MRFGRERLHLGLRFRRHPHDGGKIDRSDLLAPDETVVLVQVLGRSWYTALAALAAA